ncbi:hypothetical protein AJ80_00989 [Polytolypa hystricis UAMH7299]|uniref:Small-subunit processome Utp12 domain-containing protein n=1 Tax=Polytolypa hystricis (strain UAMH7299) TaxID=1447883 RepID=A0A2B7Z214_POLH7|nr:hypothetical protein AJ80_00989 [Polytolypa hystricis UAMH7299]
MASKKGPRAVSKISSAAAPAASSATLSANKSSVLRSAFSPSGYQLALFASVIQGLDAQHLRVHDISSGRLQCEHAVNPREVITSLDWGYYGDAHKDRDQHTKKKRKRNSGVNGFADVNENGEAVVAFGTSSSDIRMYSPTEDKILGTLSGGHENGVRDFKFTVKKPGSEGWSIGGDGKLVQWDLKTGRSIRVISLPSTSVTALARPVPSNPPVLCASQSPYLISLEAEGGDGISFNAMRNSIHTLISSSDDLATLSEQFLAADSDRYINIFDTQKNKLLGSLITDKEVESVAFFAGPQKSQSKTDAEATRSSLLQKQALAVVTRCGAIEFFFKPFHQLGESQSKKGASSLKSQRKTMTRRSEAVIKITRPDKPRSIVPIVSVSFDGSDLVVAWAEGGAGLAFERIRWQDEETEEPVLSGEHEIAKGKSASALGSAMVNGVKDLGKTQVNEVHTLVEQGGAADGLVVEGEDENAESSDEGEEEAASEDEAKEAPEKAVTFKSTSQPEDADEDIEMADADAEPSFGELLRAHAAEPIDVEAELDDTNAGALVSAQQNNALQLPPGLSLATVLSQSLKTNDTDLLESCFHTTDMNIVRATIQRLDSSLAATLLQKLAERLSMRPGRYGHLLVWVQWTCVAHGGSIAGRPDILNKMTSLFKVLDQRSASLSSLLLLKGKLDMLDAQLGLRQSLQGRSGGLDTDDEEGVIYVEGEEDEVESDEENIRGRIEPTPQRKPFHGLGLDDLSDEEDDEGMSLAINGVSSGSDDDEEDNELIIDDEAEESDDADGASDDDEDEDDEDDGSMAEFIADSEEGSIVSMDVTAPIEPVSSKRGKTKKGRSARG